MINVSAGKTLTRAQINELVLNAQVSNPSVLMYYDYSKSEMVRKTTTVCDDPAIPSDDPKVDKQKLQQWIDGHKGKYRTIAQKLANNIQYFSFEKFYQLFIDTVNILNKVYEENGIQGNEVVIAVPSLLGDKSNSWMTSLLLKHIHFKPYALVECNDSSFLSEYLKKHSHIKRVVLVDDAAYSGVDLSMYLAVINESINLAKVKADLNVVVPFISNTAKNKFLNEFSCHLFYSQIMPTIDELPELTSEEKTLLDYTCNISGYTGGSKIKINRMTLCYFAHKLADSYSVPENLMKYGFQVNSVFSQEDLNKSSSPFFSEEQKFRKQDRYDSACAEQIKFIPDITPCYKQAAPKRLSRYQQEATLRQVSLSAKV